MTPTSPAQEEVDARLLGEQPDLAERYLVAPRAGRFQPLPAVTVTAEGELVAAGQAIGVIESLGVTEQVVSWLSGWFMGLLVSPGERVTAGQPVAWLRPL